MWLDKLAEADRKRSGFQDMAAEGLINFEELREKLAGWRRTERWPRKSSKRWRPNARAWSS